MSQSTAIKTLDDLEGQSAWLYVRESTQAQGKKYGPAAQRERAQRFAAAYGVSIVRTFEDLRSGRSLNRRTAFASMLTELPASGVRAVIVAYASRWARDEFDGFATLNQLHQAAGCLVVADKALLSTEEGRFTELAREIVEAAHYSRELSRNIRDGIAEKLRVHNDVWSHPLLGFKRDEQYSTIQPDPETMPLAVRAYELSAAGLSDGAVAREIDESLWRVRGALRSPLYAGRLPDGRPTSFPPPIESALWERARSQRARRAASGHHPQHRVYPLSDRGPAVCDDCGRALKGRARGKAKARFATTAMTNRASLGPLRKSGLMCSKTRSASSWMAPGRIGSLHPASPPHLLGRLATSITLASDRLTGGSATWGLSW
jgi:DNA invertase Pin-like site-specific DNA recombinase